MRLGLNEHPLCIIRQGCPLYQPHASRPNSGLAIICRLTDTLRGKNESASIVPVKYNLGAIPVELALSAAYSKPA